MEALGRLLATKTGNDVYSKIDQNPNVILFININKGGVGGEAFLRKHTKGLKKVFSSSLPPGNKWGFLWFDDINVPVPKEEKVGKGPASGARKCLKKKAPYAPYDQPAEDLFHELVHVLVWMHYGAPSGRGKDPRKENEENHWNDKIYGLILGMASGRLPYSEERLKKAERFLKENGFEDASKIYRFHEEIEKVNKAENLDLTVKNFRWPI